MLCSVAINIVIHEVLRNCAFAVTIQWGNTVESISVFMLLILSDAFNFFYIAVCFDFKSALLS